MTVPPSNGTAPGIADPRLKEASGRLAAGVVLATAAYLHYTRLLRVLAVLTAILTAFFARTIACRVHALVFILVLSHMNYSLIL